MQAPQGQKPQPRAVVFDSSLDGDIDQVLALAMLFGLEGRRQIRVASLSTSQFNLQIARFLDLVVALLRGRPAGRRRQSRSAADRHVDRERPGRHRSSMVDAALRKTNAEGKPAYVRTLPGVNDTADAVALIRNALSAQADRNAAVVLAGRPTNLVALTGLPMDGHGRPGRPRCSRLPGGASTRAHRIRSCAPTSPVSGSSWPTGRRPSSWRAPS